MLLVTMEYPPCDMPGPPFSVEERQVRHPFERDFSVQPTLRLDVLTNNPDFRERDLTLHQECV